MRRRGLFAKREIALDDSVPEFWESAERFWTERGYKMRRTGLRQLTGRRGSYYGNLTSFDMSHLISRIDLEYAEPGVLRVEMRIVTAFQIVTEWNRVFWALEMATFESFLRNGDKKEELWRELGKAAVSAAGSWTLSPLKLGHRLDPYWAERLAMEGARLSDVTSAMVNV